MNYKSELKGFCFDRALHYHEKLDKDVDLTGVIGTADRLADYFYMADKDFQDSGAAVVELANEADLDALSDLIFALTNIKEKREATAARIAAKVQASLKPEVVQ